MKFYALNDAICMSYHELEDSIPDIRVISEEETSMHQGIIYFLQRGKLGELKRYYCVSQSDMLSVDKEDISLLYTISNKNENTCKWIIDRINERKVMGVNIDHPRFMDCLNEGEEAGLTVHLLGLGDVGGTLLTGLRLLGDRDIDTIGIYDLDDNRINRWVMEAGQIYAPMTERGFPNVVGIDKDNLFDCDIFIFCASVGVPKVGEEGKDVRLVQYEGNSRILNIYGRMAREADFKGLFAVVSDPVDMLCKSLYLSSNTSDDGELDYCGLAADQIKGYGLGVMNARAAYYARENYPYYLRHGRAYGPHGKGLIIADSIDNYNDEISNDLTWKATNANIDVRSAGFKPYIAPALSSGALAILGTIRGEWHYSTNYINGVFMGSLNRNNASGLEFERRELPELLKQRINSTYKYLEDIN